MRKLILLAIVAGFAKMLLEEWRASQARTPFPTSNRPPEGFEG
jgi:hypothetical protein